MWLSTGSGGEMWTQWWTWWSTKKGNLLTTWAPFSFSYSQSSGCISMNPGGNATQKHKQKIQDASENLIRNIYTIYVVHQHSAMEFLCSHIWKVIFPHCLRVGEQICIIFTAVKIYHVILPATHHLIFLVYSIQSISFCCFFFLIWNILPSTINACSFFLQCALQLINTHTHLSLLPYIYYLRFTVVLKLTC